MEELRLGALDSGCDYARPLAATAGLGLETTAVAQLVLIAEDNGAEIAVVADGDVVFSRRVESSSPRQLFAEVLSALRTWIPISSGRWPDGAFTPSGRD